MRLDSHHHFWKYTPHEFDWITDDMSAIRRDFLPADLEPILATCAMDGVITVEARQTLNETEWLLQLARTHDFIRGVVGWAPLIAPDIQSILEELAVQPKLKGLRHVLQGESDDYMLRADFNNGLHALQNFDLVYDILILEHQLPQAIEMVDRHPEQRFVLDHLAKPLVRDRVLQPWTMHLKELAQRPQVSCKISGLVTEADFSLWQPDDLKPYFDFALEAFGVERLMFGSDWPVCLIASSYQRWLETAELLAEELSATEKRLLFGDTAAQIYRVD